MIFLVYLLTIAITTAVCEFHFFQTNGKRNQKESKEPVSFLWLSCFLGFLVPFGICQTLILFHISVTPAMPRIWQSTIRFGKLGDPKYEKWHRHYSLFIHNVCYRILHCQLSDLCLSIVILSTKIVDNVEEDYRHAKISHLGAEHSGIVKDSASCLILEQSKILHNCGAVSGMSVKWSDWNVTVRADASIISESHWLQ